MTDEEKAEEWVKSQMVPCIQGQVSYFDFAIQAFLAGLKAGKTQKRKSQRSKLCLRKNLKRKQEII